MKPNDANWPIRAKTVYTVTLTCGHRVKTRNQPWRTDTRYGCTNGQGCGYSLAWVSWTDGNTSMDNIKK